MQQPTETSTVNTVLAWVRLNWQQLLAKIVVFAAFGLLIEPGLTAILEGEDNYLATFTAIQSNPIFLPCAIYIFLHVVIQIDHSRRHLKKTVEELHRLQEQDQELRQKYEERSALLRSFLDNSPDLVYYRDENGKFMGCNHAVEILTGKTEEELLGLTPYDVYPFEVASHTMASDRDLLKRNESHSYEYWLNYPDGRKAYFELRKIPFLDSNGKRLGLLGFGRDITERKQYQDQLEQASRDKTTFLSTISHELRTPLNGIVGLSRILLDSPLNKTQRNQLKTLHVSAITLGNIFNDIIDLDKLDRQKLELYPTQLDFPLFLEEIETLSRIQAQEKGLYLHFENHGPLPEHILVDATRLRQVIWNLVSNAVKFTDQGSVSIRVLTRWQHNQQLTLCFEIEDSGCGISAEDQTKIFNLYYQANGKQAARGSGIGLAVTRHLVEAMQGRIQVASTLGQGSTFTVTFNVTAQEKKDLQHIELPNKSILLVEDVELNIIVAQALLEKLNQTVTIARSGQEALELANQKEFDLIFLDIQLPDMNGFEIVKTLSHTKEKLPPIVALTAHQEGDLDYYRQKGMVAIVRKPIDIRVVKGLFGELFLTPTEEMNHSYAELNLEFLTEIAPDGLRRALDIFAALLPNYLSELESAIANQDATALNRIAHKLKGSAESMGLPLVGRLAAKLEHPDTPNDWVQQRQQWIQLQKQSHNDLNALKSWIETHRDDSSR